MQYPHRFSLSTNIRQAMCLPASFFWRRNRHVELLDTLAAADVVTEVMLRVPIRVYLVAFAPFLYLFFSYFFDFLLAHAFCVVPHALLCQSGTLWRLQPAVRLGSIGQTSQGSFSAVSKQNFARKYAFESSRRDLHNAFLCTVL